MALVACPTVAMAFTARTTAPSTSDFHYYSNQNPFWAGGVYLNGNCTWYAWGRAWEVRGTPLPAGYTGNAKTWWNSNALSKGSTPALGAIAVWGGAAGINNYCGHVAVVEAISGGTVTVSQSSWGGPVFAMDTVQRISTSGGCGPLLGYVYTISGVQPDRGNPIAPDDVAFTKGGASTGWTAFAGGIYGTAIYTGVSPSEPRDNWGQWTFDLSKLSGSGDYVIEAYITSSNAGTKNAVYHVNTAGGVRDKSVNQYSTSGWTTLGTYALNAGSAWVVLDDVTGEVNYMNENSRIAFDAIRLTYVRPPVPPASLSVVGAVNLSGGTHAVGNTVTGSFTVKNTGGQSGTWAPLVLAFRGPSGENRDAVASASITLAAGESKTVTFSRKLDLAGNWTGFVSGQLVGGSWQSPGGATVAFSVAAALPKATMYTPVAPSSVTHSHAFTVYGYVAPRHTSGTYLATLKFYLRNSHGVYVFHNSVNAKRYYYSTTKTKYSARVSLPHAGRWRVRAMHGDAGHSTSYSGYDYITVK